MQIKLTVHEVKGGLLFLSMSIVSYKQESLFTGTCEPLPLHFLLSLFTGTIACDNYARECEFGILKKKTKQKKNKKKKTRKIFRLCFD